MTEARLRELLQPFVIAEPGSSSDAGTGWLPAGIYAQLLLYLDLLTRWNERTNLTAIRVPAEMVTRHFGESLFTAMHLRAYVVPGATLLDVGSGAGFPGLPIQLAIPELKVTLAESQGKKASFLREAVRTLGMATEVWPKRAESMPVGRLFDVVTLRAVDKMQEAVSAGAGRLARGGVLVQLSGSSVETEKSLGMFFERAIPRSDGRYLRIFRARD